MLGAIGDGLRGARYFLGDVVFVIARFPVAVGRGVAGFWGSLPIITRRRLVAAVGVVAVVLLFAGLVVPNLPCALPGGDVCAPDDDAIELVPASAVAYLHTNLDPDTDQAERAAEVAGRMPMVSRQVIGQLAELLRVGAAVAATTEPWFEGEAGIAVLDAAGDDVVELIETSDRKAAARYAEARASGVPETSAYRDVDVTEEGRGVSSAVVDDFLVLGSSQGVRAVIDVATDAKGADALGDDDTATDALDSLPDHRFAEAYLSPDGIEALVAGPRSALASLEPLVDTGSSRAAAMSVSANEDGFSFASRSALDPERNKAEPGFFAAFDSFEPELPSNLAGDSLGYVGIGQPDETIESLLRQATVNAPGIAAGVADLIEELRGDAQVDLQRDFLEALGVEAAFAVVPRSEAEPEGDEDAVPTVSPEAATTPYLEFLADDVDEERAREALAKLQDPIAKTFDPDLGAPVFDQRKFDDVEAEVLRLSPVAQLVYAIFDSRLVIANDPSAVERLASDDDDDLADSDRYEETVEELPDEPLLIAYLDVRGLLSYAERSGLAEDTAYAAFAPDLRRLGSLGLTVSRDDDRLEADARLLVD